MPISKLPQVSIFHHWGKIKVYMPEISLWGQKHKLRAPRFFVYNKEKDGTLSLEELYFVTENGRKKNLSKGRNAA